MQEPDNRIVLDLDRERIKTVISESYKICEDFIGSEIFISAADFAAKIGPYLDSNRVTIPVQIDLPNKKYPGLKIEVDLRRKKVMARMYPRTKQAQLNYLLKAL